MSHTNSTTNYNLPQFVGTDKPTWLNDVNGAFSAIDTQMKANADSATSAGTSATTANNAIGTLSSLETTAKTDLVSAVNEVNTAVGVAQNTAVGASQTANGVSNALITFEQQFNLTDKDTDSLNITGSKNGSYYLAQNASGTIFKFYGSARVYGNTVYNRVAIPGLSGYYGCDTGLVLNSNPTTGYVINTGQIFHVASNDSAVKTIWSENIAVGTNGHIYVMASTSSGNTTVGAGIYWNTFYPPCLYFNADFGDTPTPNA